METLEKFHIFRETKSDNQTNDTLTDKANAIFEAIVHEDPYKRHTTLLHSDASHITLSWRVVHSFCTQIFFSAEDR